VVCGPPARRGALGKLVRDEGGMRSFHPASWPCAGYNVRCVESS
jgi:hypothetical protein